MPKNAGTLSLESELKTLCKESTSMVIRNFHKPRESLFRSTGMKSYRRRRRVISAKLKIYRKKVTSRGRTKATGLK
jgi:hypothetical protein